MGGIPELLPVHRMHAPGSAIELAGRIEALLADDEVTLEAESERNFEVAQRYSYDRSLAEKRRAYRALRDWCDNPAEAPRLPSPTAATPPRVGRKRPAASGSS